ncbi:hypothetical protein D3C87_1453150 [compost metagenome]
MIHDNLAKVFCVRNHRKERIDCGEQIRPIYIAPPTIREAKIYASRAGTQITQKALQVFSIRLF